MVRFLKRGHCAGKPYDEERDEECDAGMRQAESQILEDVRLDLPAYDDYDDDGVLFHVPGEPAAGRPLTAPQIDCSAGVGPLPRRSSDGSAGDETPAGKPQSSDRS